MFDKELVAEILRQIYHATLTIQKRAVLIQSANDFLDTEDIKYDLYITYRNWRKP